MIGKLMVQYIQPDHRQQVSVRLIGVALRMKAVQQQRFFYICDVKINADIKSRMRVP